eukprot:354246-Chlamydomonas_euryale.AAC.3
MRSLSFRNCLMSMRLTPGPCACSSRWSTQRGPGRRLIARQSLPSTHTTSTQCWKIVNRSVRVAWVRQVASCCEAGGRRVAEDCHSGLSTLMSHTGVKTGSWPGPCSAGAEALGHGGRRAVEALGHQ